MNADNPNNNIRNDEWDKETQTDWKDKMIIPVSTKPITMEEYLEMKKAGLLH